MTENDARFTQTDEGTRDMWERERKSKMRSNARFRMNSMHGNICGFSAMENSGSFYNANVPDERIASERIDKLADNEILVFVSNRDGNHNQGFAHIAATQYGAQQGQAEGRQGQTYAIPIIDVEEREIYEAIGRFCDYAEAHPELTFIVADFSNTSNPKTLYNVGPMFQRAAQLRNVKMPSSIWDFCTLPF